MTRALLWREWREQRRLVLAAWGITLVLPLFLVAGMKVGAPGYELGALGGMLPIVVLFGVWPVIAAASGAVTVSSDTGDESLRFLLSRPVSRRRVWTAKLLVAAGGLLLAAAGSMGIAYVVDHLISGNGGEIWSQPGAFAIAGFPIALLFASAHYCSLFVRRALAAALAGLVVAASMGACLVFTWTVLARPGMRNYDSLAGIGTGFPLAVVGLLIAGYRVFRRDDVPGDRVARRMAVPLAVVTVAVLLLGAMPATYAGLRARASLAAQLGGDLRLVGDRFVLPRRNPGGLSTAVVAGSLRGAEQQVVVPSGATLPSLSPDGEWVVHVADGGLFARSGAAHLRAVRIDGSDDHPISGPLPGWAPGAYPALIGVAPDSDHVVFSGYGDAVVTSISGGPADERRVELGENIGVWRQGAWVIGWAAGAPAELLYYRIVGRLGDGGPRDGDNRTDVEWGERMRSTELLMFDPGTGESRLVQEFAGAQGLRPRASRGPFRESGARAWQWLPAWLGEDNDLLVLVNTRSGQIVEVTRAPCAYWGFSADDRFVYGVCSGSLRTGDARAELRVRNLADGADQPFAVLEGYDASSYSSEVLLSPDGDHALIYVRNGFRSDWGTHLVTRGGGVRALAAHMAPLAWRGPGEAVVSSALLELGLQAIDIETGATRVVFP